MNAAYFIQTNIICIFIIHLVLRKEKARNMGHNAGQMYFTSLIVFLTVYCISDAAGWLLEGASFPYAKALLYAVDILYIILPLLINYVWMEYVDIQIGGKIFRNKSIRTAVQCFVILMCAISFTTPLTGFLFTLDHLNLYSRAIGAILIPIICWVMAGYCELVLLFYALKPEHAQDRERLRPMLFFFVPAIIASALQVMFYGLTTSTTGITLGVLLCFMNIQNSQISVDALTGLSNRREMDLQLERVWNSLNSGERIFLLMIDVNDFKLINDNYGHLEGDHALVAVAEAVKDAAQRSREKVYAARFGGDEFVLFGANQGEKDIALLKEDIRNMLELYNDRSGKEYRISLSIGGICGAIGSFETISRLLTLADESMYAEKMAVKGRK